MAAYLVGHITIKNRTYWEEYVDGVRKSLIPYGAEIIFRGKRFKVLAGDHQHQNTVVIKFQNQKTLQGWFSSRQYQDLIPIRDKAADVVIVSFDD